MRALWTALPLIALALLPTSAWAFTPPTVQGHVTDTSGRLSAEDRSVVNLHLERVQKSTGNHVIAFLVGSLEGNTIEDVAYQTFNAWHVGEKGSDNGVLLVIAPNERRVRIETGRGVGGEITDVDALVIIQTYVKPHLKDDRFREAILGGADGIAAKLTGRVVAKPSPANASEYSVWGWLFFALAGGGFAAFVGYWLVRAVKHLSRPGHWSVAGGSGYGSSSNSYDSSSSYSSSSSSSSSSSDSGSSYGGYGGGGGSSGGGGASDSY